MALPPHPNPPPQGERGPEHAAQAFPTNSELPGLFITGTDTGVGKTFVAAAIVRALADEGHTVGVLKPVATGAIRDGDTLRSEDAAALIAATGRDWPIDRVAPLVFEPPVAPPVAARLGGEPLPFSRVLTTVSDALAWWVGQGADVLVVEGVGGLLCPLAEQATVADLAIALDFPLLIVARRELGTINHTLLTVEAAQRRALRVAGIILNAAEPAARTLAESTNPDELARRLPGVPLLADLVHEIAHNALPVGLDRLDWGGRAAPPRRAGRLGSPA